MGDGSTAVAKVAAKDLMARETKGTFRHEVARILTAAAEVMPKHMTPDRMLALVYAAATKTPKLFDCTTASLGMCLVTCAELGLEPGIAGHVYLIPRNMKIRGGRGEADRWEMQCTLLVGYKGYCELARRSGEIASLDAVPVYAGEPFKVRRGTNPGIDHEWLGDVDRSDANLVAVYAIARMRDGSIAYEVLTRQEVDARRKRSSSSGEGPWVTDYARMARKTALRLLFAGGLVPLSADIVRAIEADDEGEDYIDVATTDAAHATRRSAMDSLRGLVQGAAESASETTTDAPTHEPNPDLADAIDKMAICDNEREIAGLLKDAADWHPADLAMVEAAAEKRRAALKS